MIPTLNSGVNNNLYLKRNYGFGNAGGIKKSVSNTQLDYLFNYKNTNKNGSSYALNECTNTTPEHQKRTPIGLKCHHLSTTNLDKINPPLFNNPKLSKEKKVDSKINISDRIYQGRLSICSTANHGNITPSNSNNQKKFGISRRIKHFFSCSKPCGILTAITGGILIIFSLLFFIFLIDENLCDLLSICSDSFLNKLSAVSALVCGFFLLIVGITIIIYIEKEVKVIKIQSSFLHDNHLTKKYEEQTVQTPVLSEKLPLKREETIDMNEYNYDINDSNNNQNLLKLNKNHNIVININDKEDKR